MTNLGWEFWLSSAIEPLSSICCITFTYYRSSSTWEASYSFSRLSLLLCSMYSCLSSFSHFSSSLTSSMSALFLFCLELFLSRNADLPFRAKAESTVDKAYY